MYYSELFNRLIPKWDLLHSTVTGKKCRDVQFFIAFALVLLGLVGCSNYKVSYYLDKNLHANGVVGFENPITKEEAGAKYTDYIELYTERKGSDDLPRVAKTYYLGSVDFVSYFDDDMNEVKTEDFEKKKLKSRILTQFDASNRVVKREFYMEGKELFEYSTYHYDDDKKTVTEKTYRDNELMTETLVRQSFKVYQKNFYGGKVSYISHFFGDKEKVQIFYDLDGKEIDRHYIVDDNENPTITFNQVRKDGPSKIAVTNTENGLNVDYPILDTEPGLPFGTFSLNEKHYSQEAINDNIYKTYLPFMVLGNFDQDESTEAFSLTTVDRGAAFELNYIDEGKLTKLKQWNKSELSISGDEKNYIFFQKFYKNTPNPFKNKLKMEQFDRDMIFIKIKNLPNTLCYIESGKLVEIELPRK